MTRSGGTIWLLAVLVMISAVVITEPLLSDKQGGNSTRWEESLADQIADRFGRRPAATSQIDSYLYSLWAAHERSSGSETSRIVEETREAIKHAADLDMRFRMIELLLFAAPWGPITSPVRGPDDGECLISTVELFEKHCGPPIIEYGSKHISTFVKTCSNMVDRDGVEEAFKAVCSIKTPDPLGTTDKTAPLLLEPVDEQGVRWEPSEAIRWEPLEAITDQVAGRFAKMGGGALISQEDVPLHYLWLKYASSSRSEKSKSLEQMGEVLSYMANFDARIAMIELFLFGPPDGTVISPVRDDPGPPSCVESTRGLFYKHCGSTYQYGMKHRPTFIEICKQKVDTRRVEEAFKVTCSSRTLEPLGMTGRKSRGRDPETGLVF